MEYAVAKVALVLALGVAAQWLAWRFKAPAIVLLAAAGILAGPVGGFLDPERNLGPLLEPIVSLAVAIILFEGGLSLNIGELRGLSRGVRRMTLYGAPIAWLLGALAARCVGGLSWPSAAVLGGVLVVTGPTVIAPLLRQARLARKPATTLKWESIVNDPVGALFAVLAFEVAVQVGPGGGLVSPLLNVVAGAGFAGALGLVSGVALAAIFKAGHTPEFLKAPMIVAAVLAVFAGSDAVLEESGLVAVTVLGVVLGNSGLAALDELRRSKELLVTLLLSAVFILLTATLRPETIATLDWRHVLFVAAVLFLVRPATIFLCLAGTDVPWRHKALYAWIAPRGIVAVAVSGLFGTKLVEAGLEDGALLVPLSFAVVLVTVLAHGFSLAPVAKRLGLRSERKPGVLVVGAGAWATAFAEALKAMDTHVVLADTAWWRLRRARQAGIETFYGEVLSEAREHYLEFGSIGALFALTDNDAYNTLVCAAFGPEIGRAAVFQPPVTAASGAERHTMAAAGRVPAALKDGTESANAALAAGWTFRSTKITERFDEDAFLATLSPQSRVVLVVRADGRILAPSERSSVSLRAGDRALTFGPPEAAAETSDQQADSQERA